MSTTLTTTTAATTTPATTSLPTAPAELDPRALRDAYGTFPSGVVAVAAQHGSQLVGIAASSFTSVSLDPPLVQVCVASSSRTWPALREAGRDGGRLGISVLAEHHDVLCRQLAGPAQSRFAGLGLTLTGDGAVLLDDAVSTFTVSVAQEVEAGDHVIVLLQVHDLAPGAAGDPLVFHRSGFARLHRDDLDPAVLDGRINGEPVADRSATLDAVESGTGDTGDTGASGGTSAA